MPLLTQSIRAFCALACLLFCASALSRADDGDERSEAKAVEGLRIRLQLPEAEKDKKTPLVCEVVLENVGDKDLNVNLGSSLANGRSHHPTALRLHALSEGAKARTLVYSMRVAGRLDPFVVPLPAGSSYTLRIPFAKFTDSETGESIDLTAKEYRIVAQLVGEPVTNPNRDAQAQALMPYWQGKASSHELPIPFDNLRSKK